MSSGAAAPKEPTVLSEEDDVFRWRAEQFRQLGFNELEARGLAASPADLGHARYLLGSGCPPALGAHNPVLLVRAASEVRRGTR